AGRGVRQLRRSRKQVLLAVVKQQLTRQNEVSAVGLLIVDRAIRLAKEKLAVEIQLRCGIRREQAFAISAVTADPIGSLQVGQIQRLAQERRGNVSKVV